MNKANDDNQKGVTVDYWLYCIVTAFNVGVAFTTIQQAGPLALRYTTNAFDMA